MKSPFSILILVSLAMLFASCNNPMSRNYSPSTYMDDINAIRESDKASYGDIELITRYITLSKIAGNDLEGKSYKEILERIKDIQKANTDQSDQVSLQKGAARERAAAYLSVTLSGKVFSKVNNKDCFIYTVSFQNTTTKNIRMVVGSISLNDLLDREIKNISIVLDEPLKAMAAVKKTYTVGYNSNSEADKSIRLKELVDLGILWNPEKIIFEDGTIAD